MLFDNRQASTRMVAQSSKGQEAFAPICVPSMFDSLEVEVLYPA
jgi:hypothetical protein